MTFEKVRSLINFYTAVDDNRLRFIYDNVMETYGLSGAMAEIGVYKGGSSLLIASTDPTRKLYVCDSFIGLPNPNEKDENTVHGKGDFSDTSLESVQNVLKDCPNIQLFKGFFPNPDIHSTMYDKQYSFVHIDVDLYTSTLNCLEFFYPRMIKGGVIVLDDYQWKDTPGVKTAIDEFMSDKSEIKEYSGYNSCRIKKL